MLASVFFPWGGSGSFLKLGIGGYIFLDLFLCDLNVVQSLTSMEGWDGLAALEDGTILFKGYHMVASPWSVLRGVG